MTFLRFIAFGVGTFCITNTNMRIESLLRPLIGSGALLEPPSIMGDCATFNNRLSMSIHLKGFKLPNVLPNLNHESAFADLDIISTISEMIDCKRPRINQLDVGVRANSRYLLLLAAYFQPCLGDENILIPVLTKALQDTKSGTRALALVGMAKLGRRAKSVLPYLRKMRKDRNPFVQLHAAYALFRITKMPSEALPTLKKHLASNQPFVPELAAFFVSKLGPDGKPAVNSIIRLLDHRDPIVRAQGIVTLAQIEPSYKVVMPLFEKVAADSKNNERVAYTYYRFRTGRKELQYGLRPIKDYAWAAIDRIRRIEKGRIKIDEIKGNDQEAKY